MSDSRTRHFISNRRLEDAFIRSDRDGDMTPLRELLDEAWNKGMSAGQMKERLSRVSGHSPVF